MLADQPLGLDGRGERLLERRLPIRSLGLEQRGGRHRAAVHAADRSLAFERVEVGPSGDGGDAECRAELRDPHEPALGDERHGQLAAAWRIDRRGGRFGRGIRQCGIRHTCILGGPPTLCNTKPGCLRNESRVGWRRAPHRTQRISGIRRHRRSPHRGASLDARRRPRAHLLRRRRHHAAGRASARRTRARPPPGDRAHATGPAHGRVDLDRGGQAEPRLPPAGRPRPAGTAEAGQPVGDPEHLRRRGVREPVAVVRSRARRTGCLQRRRPGRTAPGRARAHVDLGRPLRGRVLQPRARGLIRHAQRLARAAR